MTRVFISYRRATSADVAVSLASELRRLRDMEVLLDIDSIEPGISFGEAMSRALDSSDVLLLLIGPDWAGGINLDRLKDPNDQVRSTVARALASGKRVIP